MTLTVTEKILLLSSISSRIEQVRKLIEMFKDKDQWLFEYYNTEIEQLTKLHETIINLLVC
jgi:oligoribonuclease NrnB/cAMP/cGMP phosphodiesterase (DHH superfamily)